MRDISLRSAAIILKDGKLLVAKNVNSPCYYVVGGAIEKNETSEQAIIREIFEETGLKIEVDRLLMIQERFFEAGNKKHHEIVFFYSIKDNDTLSAIANGTFTDQGIKETLHWLPADKLRSYNIVPKFLQTKSFEDMKDIEHIVVNEY